MTTRILSSRFPAARRSLLPLLTAVQLEDRFLSEAAIRDVGHHLGLTDNEVFGVASFYPWFRLAPATAEELETPAEPLSRQAAPPGSGGVVVCNAARGEPEDVDRLLLENEPRAVVEGLVAEAKRLGFDRGVLWVDVEWSAAAQRVARAVEQAREEGLVIEAVRVPGALMHREEAAFLRAFEGWRPTSERLPGQPQGERRPEETKVAVYTAEALFRMSGGENSNSALYVLSGSIAEPGVVEVAAGSTVRQLLEKAGGVLPKGKALKAFQAGGPLGQWFPPDRLDEPADSAGLGASPWGSGSFLFVNTDACAVDLAARTLDFLTRNLCGKCAVCREGTMQMAEVLRDITEGKGKAGDVDLLVELGEALAVTGSCALGRAAPNPVLSTIRSFRDEVDAHVRRSVCLSGRCRFEREG